MSTRYFHITSRAAWQAAQRTGEYRAPSLDEVGFIHLSTRAQWLDTVLRFYRGVADLVLLELDADRLTAPVRFEPADGQEFPHLFGPLALGAVIAVHELPVVVERPDHDAPWLLELLRDADRTG